MKYPDVPSAVRPVPLGTEIPISEPPSAIDGVEYSSSAESEASSEQNT